MPNPTPPTEVQCHRHDGWAELVLNRPERRNAIDGLLAHTLLAHLTALRADEGIRAILLRGEGGALCSGPDLKAFNADPAPEWLPRFADTWHAVHLALLQCPRCWWWRWSASPSMAVRPWRLRATCW